MWAAKGYSQNPSDYLVCQDIGGFKKYGCACGSGGGILVPAGHFGEDHNDISCTVIYHSMAQRMGIDAEVTKHANPPDSIKWLLHEVEDSYRDNDNSDGRLGLLSGAGVKIRDIGGNKFIFWGLGGGSYTWISGQKVIEIKYTDLQRTKTEPIEVVQAYLQKHPSTIPASFVFDQAHDVQWIKDEMDRRFWLCDQWFMKLQLRKAEEKQVYHESVKSMNIFLDYREKYYNLKAAVEKNLLAGYLTSNNGTGIKTKLDEYKKWWVVNKDKAISL